MEMGIVTIVHAVLAVLLIIELGLTGASKFDRLLAKLSARAERMAQLRVIPFRPLTFATTAVHNSLGWSSRANFMLFNAIWSILVVAYLAITPRVLTALYHGVIALGALVLTALFWFAGSIALAVPIGVHCGGYGPCQTAQAAIAFGFFLWAIFTGLAVMEALASRRGGIADKSSRV